MNVKLFQEIIGSLLYLALRKTPHILTAVLILARFQKNPSTYCHMAVKRIFQYLRGTSSYGINYEAAGFELNRFVDSDYAGDKNDRKSLSGYKIKLGGACCIWGSEKQTTVALSTCEAEYHAINLACKEMIWVIRVLSKIGINVDYTSKLRSDNQSTINWATSERCPSTRAKHIDVQVHYVKQMVNNKR